MRPGLALGHADAAKLRVDEHRVRDDPVARARLLVPDEVGVQDAVIVVGKVGEGRAALDVTHRVNAGDTGLQVLVDLDEAVVVETDAGRLGGERLRIRDAADGRQQVRAFELSLTVLRANGQPQAAAVGGLNPGRRRRGQDRDPVIAQDSGDLVRDVLVLDHYQARGALDDGDLAAEPAEHLPELQPDVAAAEDDQVLRELVQLHDRR